ncbi:Imm21 family immunity protein [Streptomyces sp. NPDC058206]|uniref:Imm21 family immunity protein n=1 Tax=Streptomyces sp. NPDC058206 TaxID=3346382 RepID=UPI0036E3FF9A
MVVPVSALARLAGCTAGGMVNSDAGTPDDYDRACAVEDLAGVIVMGEDCFAISRSTGPSSAGWPPTPSPTCWPQPRPRPASGTSAPPTSPETRTPGSDWSNFSRHLPRTPVAGTLGSGALVHRG